MHATSGAYFSGLRPESIVSAAQLSAPQPAEYASKKPFVIGVSRGTASGKTTVCDKIPQLQDHRVVLVDQVVERGLEYLPFTEKQDPYTPGVISARNYVEYPLFEVVKAWRTHCDLAVKWNQDWENPQSTVNVKLIYEKLPMDISQRHALLSDPVLATGNSDKQAIQFLLEKGVPESQIIFLNLIFAPKGIQCVCKHFPALKIVTSEIDVALKDEFRVIPGMGGFEDWYFGTYDYSLPTEDGL